MVFIIINAINKVLKQHLTSVMQVLDKNTE